MDHHTERDPSFTVSVVVPTRDGGPVAAGTVAHALADPATSEVVVVVDQAGTPGADLAALRDCHERVRVVHGDGRGPACARALGARLATGDVVLFLDDDVVPGPSLTTGHARAHRRHPHAVVVGAMPVAPGACSSDATARVYARDYERVVARYAHPDAVLRDLWGGNVSIRRADCLAVGMTAERFVRALHEDRDFGLRCREAGLTGVFDATLVAEHRYSRPVRRFLELAREQVYATLALHALHPEALGPWDPEQYVRTLPAALRVAIRVVTAQRWTARLAVEILVTVNASGRTVHARHVEDVTLWLARTIVQHGEARHARDPSARDERRDAGHHHHEAEHDVDECAGDRRLREVSGLLA